MKRNVNSIKYFWNNIKYISIQIIRVPEEEEKEKGSEKIFEEMIFKNFFYMKTSQSSSGRAESLIQDKPEMNTARHILIKLTKIKYKEKMLKVVREKKQI